MSSTQNTLDIKEHNKIIGDVKSSHSIYHKFSKFITNAYGKDLYGEWQFMEFKDQKGKITKLRYRGFNETELSRRLVGYDVMVRVRNYINKYLPEVKIVSCDDDSYAGSMILLIPHPRHGITIIYIPQLSRSQNQFFLYQEHYKQLMKALRELNYVYKDLPL